ncbi:GvpL/GvpF family gas vesicle protein [Plantactinospora sp. KLBMP9567]|uniref:GvpL/GvpF family gas vesicle protein n=1 Tax=Plantactinospora sp. KLBMP9567 TaxID=3085900 RepID=UPI0029828C68|nr:GvpL/GvpF family gas vesicle protein [Plantactinospora sp. KLBMP9567]MDW5328267.1 GvpL/GvpF family gas vesicle protein [Plantactinospora sp. KLBMP9567]
MAPTSTVDSGAGQLLYGLVPADVEVTPQARGLGDPLGPVGTIRYGDVAALVSETPLDVRLGRPEDLLAYRDLLDGVAVTAEVPVLPVRFGTVLPSTAAVTELLALRHDEYRAALAELDGRVEYVVRARYVERALLAGVLAEEPEAADLRDRLRDRPAEADVDLRIRLGEIVARAVEAHRAADTEWLTGALAPYCLAEAPLPAHHEQDAARVAFLVERRRRAAFTDAVRDLADAWRDWATVRTVGPAAPWDFVPSASGR